MNRSRKTPLRIAVLAVAGLLASAPVLADKPSWAGGGKEDRRHEERSDDRRDEKHESHHEDQRGDRRDEHREGRHDSDRRSRVEFRFGDDNRRAVADYYGPMFRAGNCPPGLAKKHNGCQPPGQAKKWARGRPLPAGLEYYELPHELLLRLPPPPENHRYVRVASDILLITIGTSMVMDALEDIGR